MRIRPRTWAIIGVGAIIVAGAVGTAVVMSGGDDSASGNVTWWVPNWDRPVAEELVEKFEAENPGITVTIVETTADTLANKVKVALDSGTTPDVITELASRSQVYIAADQLADLSDVYGDAMPKDDFINGSVEAVSKDGKEYGVPYRWDCIALLYNKTMFDAAGITDAPTTWDEMIEDATQLTAGDVAGIGWPLGQDVNTVLRYMGFSLSGGATIDDGTPHLTVDASTQALDLIGGTVVDGIASKSSLEVDNTGLRQLFISGRVAMYVGGMFDIDPIQEAGIEVGTALIPGPDGPGTQTADGWAYIVPKESENIDGAKKLVEFLTEAENMNALTLTFPARVSAAEDPKYHDELREPYYLQLSEHSVPAPSNPLWNQVIPVVYSEIQSVALGQTTSAESAEVIEEQANTILGLN